MEGGRHYTEDMPYSTRKRGGLRARGNSSCLLEKPDLAGPRIRLGITHLLLVVKLHLSMQAGPVACVPVAELALASWGGGVLRGVEEVSSR